jgi:excisionase family DNA binding protein
MRLTNQWLTIPQAGRLLGRSARAVHRAIERGSLPVCRIPGSHDRISASYVSELLAAAQVPARLREPAPSGAAPVRLREPVCAA